MLHFIKKTSFSSQNDGKKTEKDSDSAKIRLKKPRQCDIMETVKPQRKQEYIIQHMKGSNTLIYVVEDDEGIQEVYEGAFEDVYQVNIFSSGKDFFDAFGKKKPTLIILDIMLPDMDGYTILTKIREMDERLPVIIVSAKSDEISFVKGLNKGADDYMSKPFSILELMARVKTNLRRASLYVSNAGDFTVDSNTYKILYCGTDLKLTLKEFNLFKILIGQAGITVNRETLFRNVWGEDYMGETRTLDMHMATLRDKIKCAGGSGDCIVTVRGIGYRFEPV